MAARRGRPKREEERKVIYLYQSTFETWNKLKEQVREDGRKLMSNNEFAVFMLSQLSARICHEERRSRSEENSNTTREHTTVKDHCYLSSRVSPTLVSNQQKADVFLGEIFVCYFYVYVR